MPFARLAVPFALLIGSEAFSLFGGSSLEVQGAFDRYRAEYNRPYTLGSQEYSTRLVAFTERYRAVARQNSMPNRTWTAGLNMLTDRNAQEIKNMKGYQRQESHSHSGLQLFQMREQPDSVLLKDLPKDWDWTPHLKSLHEFADQGMCGSCWAVGAVVMLQAFSELYQDAQKFSVQQIVSCMPNPEQCGGDGGCTGATALLALDHVWKYGVKNDHEFPYTGRTGSCPSGDLNTMKMYDNAIDSQKKHGGDNIGMTGWTKLPENKLAPLLLTVYERGPVAVSVMADDSWSFYNGGILAPCKKEAIIDHLVTLTGFGQGLPSTSGEAGNKYYMIQNSWGSDWGEKGFLRLHRHSDEEEASYCGWDTHPLRGNGCKGGPAKVWVCGSCGILNENVVPTFRTSPKSLMAMNFLGRSGALPVSP